MGLIPDQLQNKISNLEDRPENTQVKYRVGKRIENKEECEEIHVIGINGLNPTQKEAGL